MIKKTYDIALVGATGLVGEAVIEQLASRKLPIGKLHLLTDKESAGAKIEFKGQYLPLQDMAKFDFSQVQIALFNVSAEHAAKLVPKAAKTGCVAIDSSAHFRLEPDVPLVVAGVNSESIAQYTQRNIIASPASIVVEMLLALAPLNKAVGIERINVSTYQSASSEGKAGVEELAGQTVALLNMQPVKPKLFAKQLAFNVLPCMGKIQQNGYTSEEMALLEETRKVFANPELKVSATAVQVPVFFGHGMSVHLETNEKITVEGAAKLLSNSPGIKLHDESKAGGFPTAVTEAAGKEIVYIGRLREDISHPHGLDLWVVTDNIRRGVALNSVQIAEFLIKNCL